MSKVQRATAPKVKKSEGKPAALVKRVFITLAVADFVRLQAAARQNYSKVATFAGRLVMIGVDSITAQATEPTVARGVKQTNLFSKGKK